MWTGRQTQGEIEAAIAKLRREEGVLDSAQLSAAQVAERWRHERTTAFREPARIKLGEMQSGRLIRDLDAAESRAMQILEDRRLHLEAAGNQRQAATEDVERAERARHDAGHAVELALEAVDELRAKVENEIRTTSRWAEAKKAFDAADAVTYEAEKKAAQSEAELAEKKKAV